MTGTKSYMSRTTQPARDAQTAYAEPGVSLVEPGQQATLDQHIVRAVGPRASEWLPDVLDAFLPTAARAVRALAAEYDPRILTDGRPRLFPQEVLHRKHGVSALAGSWADAITKYALQYAGVDPETLNNHERTKRDRLVDTLTQVGTGRDALNSGLDTLDESIVPLLDAANSNTDEGVWIPTLAVFLDGPAWTNVADERTADRALDTLATLGQVIDIQLVCSPQLEAHLERAHPEWYDEHLRLTDTGDGSSKRPPDGSDKRALMEAWEVVREFTPGSGRLRLLAALSTADDGEGGETTRSREVRALKRDFELSLSTGTVDRYVRELADEHGLLDIDDRRKYNRVSLTERGRAAQRLLDTDARPRHPAQSQLETHLTCTPQCCAGTVYRADQLGSPPTASSPLLLSSPEMSSASSSPSSTAEKWLTDTGHAEEDGFIQWLGGPDKNACSPHESGVLDAWGMHERLFAGRRVDGITLVDDPIDRFEDGRVGYLSCFDDHAQAVVQWGGSLCTLVRIASILLSDKAFGKLLTITTLGEEFERVYDGAFTDTVDDILYLGAQLGWLPRDAYEYEYDNYRGRLEGVRQLLLKKLGELANSDDTEARTELYNDAHGLLTLATHLYRAAGLDVTIHLRVPDTEMLQRDESRYEDFLTFLQHTVPKQTAYGVHSGYRSLLEHRTEKLKMCLPIDVDPTEPTADVTAAWVITGPDASGMQHDIEEALAANDKRVREAVREGNEAAPTLDIPVATGNTYGALKPIIERHATRKGYRLEEQTRNARQQQASSMSNQTSTAPKHDVERLLRCCMAALGREPGRASPYDVAETLLHIGKNGIPNASLALSDIEYGLSQVPVDRLFPALPPSATAMVKTLLSADEPLGRSEIIERAGISGSSYDRHIGELAALAIVEPVGEHSQRRWNAYIEPWWSPASEHTEPRSDVEFRVNGDRPPTGSLRPADVFWWLIVVLGIDDSRNLFELFSWPRDLDEIVRAAPVCERWLSFVKTYFDVDLGSESATAPSVARIGRPPSSVTPAQTHLTHTM